MKSLPQGVNIKAIDGGTDQKYLLAEEQKFLQSIKRVSTRNKNQSHVFQHKDEFGQIWNQDYQYVQFASSNGDLMRSSFFVKVEIRTQSLVAN